jgi:hypothetical protein
MWPEMKNMDLNKVVHSLGRLLDVSSNIFFVDNNLKYLLSNIDKLKAVFQAKLFFKQSCTDSNAELGNCVSPKVS